MLRPARRRGGGGEIVGEGRGGGGGEWNAPGAPRGQVNRAMLTPLLVERLRVDVPARAQTAINYFTDVPDN